MRDEDLGFFLGRALWFGFVSTGSFLEWQVGGAAR